MFQNQLIAADEIFRTGGFCGSSWHFASLGACCGFAASRTQRLGASVKPAENEAKEARFLAAETEPHSTRNSLNGNYLARDGGVEKNRPFAHKL
jgi:hypothetical protein